MSEMYKKWGVTNFVLERTCPEGHLNLSKSGFPSEEDYSGCKSHNIAIRALKGSFLCQIWFYCEAFTAVKIYPELHKASHSFAEEKVGQLTINNCLG